MTSDRDDHKHIVDRIALINAVISGVALYPQLYLLIIDATHVTAVSLSVTSFGLILSNSLIWLWYGIHRHVTALIISSFLNAMASGVILFLILS